MVEKKYSDDVMQAVQRCREILNFQLEMLEQFQASLTSLGWDNDTQEKWDTIFGAKETRLSVLQKLIAMQKILADLQEKYLVSEEGAALEPEECDWPLLALCVDRWRAQQEAELTASEVLAAPACQE